MRRHSLLALLLVSLRPLAPVPRGPCILFGRMSEGREELETSDRPAPKRRLHKRLAEGQKSALERGTLRRLETRQCLVRDCTTPLWTAKRSAAPPSLRASESA